MKTTLSILPWFLFLFRAVSSTCYFPNGSPIQDTPCNPSAPHSTCCGPGYACLSNNICALTEHVPSDIAKLSPFYVRGSCTDSEWLSSECPSFCVDSSSGDNLGVGGMGIGKCDGDGSVDRYYCRNTQTADLSNGVLCKNETYYFDFEGFPTTVTVIGVVPTPTSNTPTSKHSQSPSPSSRLSSKDKHQCTRLRLGLGVGLGFGLPLIVAIGFLLFLIRSRRPCQISKVADDGSSTSSPASCPQNSCSHNTVPGPHEVPLSPMREMYELS